jgi:hypothetical protein
MMATTGVFAQSVYTKLHDSCYAQPEVRPIVMSQKECGWSGLQRVVPH